MVSVPCPSCDSIRTPTTARCQRPRYLAVIPPASSCHSLHRTEAHCCKVASCFTYLVHYGMSIKHRSKDGTRILVGTKKSYGIKASLEIVQTLGCPRVDPKTLRRQPTVWTISRLDKGQHDFPLSTINDLEALNHERTHKNENICSVSYCIVNSNV